MKTGYLVLFLLILQVAVFSAHTDTIPDKNNGIERRYGISLRNSVPPIMGLAFDAFLSPGLNAEITVAPQWGGFGGGLHYHFWPRGRDKNWNPYVGIKYGYAGKVKERGLLTGNVHEYKTSALYFPVGVGLSPNRRFNFAVDGGFATQKKGNINHKKFLMSFKLGFRF